MNGSAIAPLPIYITGLALNSLGTRESLPLFYLSILQVKLCMWTTISVIMFWIQALTKKFNRGNVDSS
jgi:hypothetical protein